MTQTARHYLFVCYMNRDRSPTAEEVCRNMARAKGLDIEVSSAGVSSYARRPVTKAIADEADLIFVMEEWMRDELVNKHDQPPEKIVCFDIDDVYERGESRLVRLLQEALEPYLTE
jgi:predicted protein tyrosine phosphatase